jgi:carbon monoxide dehydrogenase subunit G
MCVYHAKECPVKISGNYTINATQTQVWTALNDIEVLARVVPGCESLAEVGENQFEGTIKIGIAGIKGVYSGKIRLEDVNPPQSYKLVAAGKGSNGVVDGVGFVELEPLEGGKTNLKYSGEAQIGGMLASVGQRLIDGASKQLIGQALKALEQQILQRIPAEPVVAESVAPVTPAIADAPNETIPAASAVAAQESVPPVTPAAPKKVVLSESEQMKPETLVAGMMSEMLNTTTGRVIAAAVLLLIGFLIGRSLH